MKIEGMLSPLQSSNNYTVWKRSTKPPLVMHTTPATISLTYPGGSPFNVDTDVSLWKTTEHVLIE